MSRSSLAGMIPVEQIGDDANFRRLDSLRGVRFDLRYAGSNNFAGVELYRQMDSAWLRPEAAEGEQHCADEPQ